VVAVVMSSSRAGRFTDEELEALDAWTALENFGSARSESVEVSQATQVMTVEEIEAMQQQAYTEAFEQGRQQGYEVGVKQGFETGHVEGLAAGKAQGYEDGRELLEKQAAELVQLMEALSEPLQQLDQAIEDEIVQLALAVASQIVRREIKSHPDEIVAVVRHAISVLPVASQNVTLNLHPEDAELLRAVLKLDENPPPWRLQENPLITRGGCSVETEYSSIDATVEKRLAAVIAKALGGERHQDQS
jgi:flagellar assembly protein FliH